MVILAQDELHVILIGLYDPKFHFFQPRLRLIPKNQEIGRHQETHNWVPLGIDVQCFAVVLYSDLAFSLMY